MLTKVYVSGFLAFTENAPLDLDFRHQQLTFVIGKNGSGKTSFFEAVFFALFGGKISRVGNDLTSFVNTSSTKATVIIELDHGGTQYRITRCYKLNSSRTSGTHSLTIEEKDHDVWVNALDQSSVKAGDAYIRDVLGLNFETFFSLAAIRQKGGESGTVLTRASTTERRTILQSLFPQLAQWSEFYDVCVAERKRLRRECAVREGAVDQAEKLLETANNNRQDAMVREDNIRAQLPDAITSVDDAVSHMERLRAMSQKLSLQLSSMREEQRQLAIDGSRCQRDADKLDNTLTRIDELRDELTALDSHMNRYDENISTNESDRDIYAERLHSHQSALDDVKKSCAVDKSKVTDLTEELNTLISLDGLAACPTCGQPLDERHRRDHIDDISHQLDHMKTSLRANCARQDHLADSVHDDEQNLSEVTAELTRLLTLKKKDHDRMEIIRQELSTIDIKSLQQQYDTTMTRLEELASLHDHKEQDIAQIRDHKADVDNDIETLAQQSSLFDQLRSLQGELKALDRQIKNAEKAVMDADSDLEDFHQQYKDAQFLAEACSPQGIPAAQLSGIVSAINAEQNRFLSRILGERHFTLMLEEFSESKSGVIKPSLDFVVETNEGKRPMESFSGGERVRLVLANLAALVTVANRAGDTMIDTLFLDEPFGALDDDSSRDSTELLGELIEQGVVKQIFLITHNGDTIINGQHKIIFAQGKATYVTE